MTRPSAAELLERPAGVLLTRSHLRELGLGRRAVDAVFAALPVVILEGYAYSMIRAEDYLALIAERTYDESRVHPVGRLRLHSDAAHRQGAPGEGAASTARPRTRAPTFKEADERDLHPNPRSPWLASGSSGARRATGRPATASGGGSEAATRADATAGASGRTARRTLVRPGSPGNSARCASPTWP